MKRSIFRRLALVAALMAPIPVCAQPEAGTMSIQPRVGISSTFLTNAPVIMVADPDVTIKRSFFPGFYAGADFSYQMSDLVGVSAGLAYSMQGCRWKDYESEAFDVEDMMIKLGYIHLPLTASFFAFEGFSISTGVQFSLLTSADWKFKNIQKQPEKIVTKSDQDMMDEFNHFDVSIPIAVSYEFDSHFVLTAQYNVSLTNLNKDSSMIPDKMRNHGVMLTAGYRFTLNP